MKYDARACKFNMDTGCVELLLRDATCLLYTSHPVDIYRIGQDDPAKLRGWKKYVFPIYTAYNGKCRKDALPMKF